VIRRALACLLAACAPLFAAAVPGAADLDAILAPTAISSMAISPDGKQLAAIGFNGFRSALFVLDAQTLAARMLVSPEHTGSSPIRAAWVSPELLAVDYENRRCEVVDLAGKSRLVLGERFIRSRRENGVLSDWVLAFHDLENGGVSQVNVRTGERKKYRVSLSGTPVHWAFDANGAMRAVTMMDTAFWSDKTKLSNWYRADEQSEWQLLDEVPVTADAWTPLFVPPEPHTLIVHSRHQRDTTAIFLYDTQKHEHVELMAGHPHEDILNATGLDQPTFNSVITEGIKPEVHWFDPRWASLQNAIDAALPQRVNLLSGNPRGRLLVFSYSDVDPGRWFVVDTDGMKMWEATSVKPKVDPHKMLPMATIEYRSTDGLVIPAYLTLPASGGAAAPLVVLIHGGPSVRDRWQWNEEVQILAANGYAVFQPQFRGSSGFGQRFEEAGFGQWGRAMQDDITAGVNHLIEQKIADPNRICIYGASYGGYAALWGVVKTPALYKCGISFAGVSDIEYMLKDWSDRNSNPVGREFQRARIGTLDQGKEQFDQVSPLKQAARIQVPLLLAHGRLDQRVPIAHSRKMMAALKENGKQYEWLMFDDEGHGIGHVRNKQRYYKAVLDFLGRHIGAQVAVPQQQTAASTH